MEQLPLALLWYFAFLFSTVLHEAAHGYVALRLGDPTAYHGGQVTIAPWPHIRREPFGTVLVPALSFILGGWMIGWASTPYDPVWARNYPRRSAWMSLAGPLSNLILVLAAALSIRLGVALDLFYAPDSVNFSHITAATQEGIFSAVATFLSIFFSLNLILFLFNLIPLPPLDGSGAIPLFLGEENARRYLDFIQNPGFMFLGIFLAWRIFGDIFGPLHLACLNLLYPGVGYH